MEKIIEECMINQPIINIGMIGNVANGKSTVTRQLTGKITQQHSTEKKNNITIKLGYANAKIYKCSLCPIPECYKSVSSSIYEQICDCGEEMDLVNHVSFVDCPGHNSFTATMLNGSSIMNNTILIEAVNGPEIPGPQTIEHLNAIKQSCVPNMVVCMNKMDLVKKDIAISKINELKSKLINTPAERSDIIPISANFGCNLNVLAHYLATCKIPEKELHKPVRMIIIRSFNINKVNTPAREIQGGVVGGSIVEGMINLGDEFIIKPGFVVKNTEQKSNERCLEKEEEHCTEELKTSQQISKWKCYPLISKVISINADNNKLTKAIAGGLIGICSEIDPSLTVNDRLIGNILTQFIDGRYENDVYESIIIDFFSLDDTKIIKKGDKILINHNACNTNAYVDNSQDKFILHLIDRPMCARINDKITISTNVGGFFIIGYGVILDGTLSDVIY